MNRKHIAFIAILISFTVTAVFAFQKKPTAPIEPLPKIDISQKPKIEVVFALDTTSSMSGLIAAAKEKIWSIASTMAAADPAPEIRVGLVAYRDRGDAYVTKVIDMSTDLDSVYAQLMDFRAQGGGDGPESVNQALADAVNKISWSQDPKSYKVIFLVGDAPAHMDYQDDIPYMQSVAKAQSKGIIVNTILCGDNHQAKRQWQHVASLSQGNYFSVGQSGNAVAVVSPYDKKIAELSKALDETRLFYGSKETKKRQEKRVRASKKLHEESSLQAQARRAEYNTSASGRDNFLGDSEMLDDIATGKIALEAVSEEHLPAEVQALPKPQRSVFVKKKAVERKSLNEEIQKLVEQRKQFIAEKVKKDARKKESLDQKLLDTMRKQAKEKGIHYDSSDDFSY